MQWVYFFMSWKTLSTYNTKDLFCHTTWKKNAIAFSLSGTDYVVMYVYGEKTHS